MLWQQNANTRDFIGQTKAEDGKTQTFVPIGRESENERERERTIVEENGPTRMKIASRTSTMP